MFKKSDHIEMKKVKYCHATTQEHMNSLYIKDKSVLVHNFAYVLLSNLYYYYYYYYYYMYY